MSLRSNINQKKIDKLDYIYVPGCIHTEDIIDIEKMNILMESMLLQREENKNIKDKFENEINKVSQKYIKIKKEKLVMSIIGVIAAVISKYITLTGSSNFTMGLFAVTLTWGIMNSIEMGLACYKLSKVIPILKKKHINSDSAELFTIEYYCKHKFIF